MPFPSTPAGKPATQVDLSGFLGGSSPSLLDYSPNGSFMRKRGASQGRPRKGDSQLSPEELKRRAKRKRIERVVGEEDAESPLTSAVVGSTTYRSGEESRLLVLRPRSGHVEPHVPPVPKVESRPRGVAKAPVPDRGRSRSRGLVLEQRPAEDRLGHWGLARLVRFSVKEETERQRERAGLKGRSKRGRRRGRPPTSPPRLRLSRSCGLYYVCEHATSS
ncbi:hypothetical protein RUM44_010472 [Polyplax serrata]|uniref:Uncharacterized protein n=1 Tax=Polyplax serrata TaxID=468196 RepID=A0ABR1AVL8_POLSC